MGKSIKEVDREEAVQLLKTLMPLSEQVAPIVRRITKVDANDMLVADLEDFLEAVKELPPILESMKRVPKPKDKELRKYKKEIEDSLDACIKACKWYLKFAESPSRVRLASIVFQMSVATSLMESATQRLTLLTNK